MNWDPLTITILIIFGTTLIATILQRRAKDPCLKKFNGNMVFIQLKTGKWVWGSLHVFAKSLELSYEKPNRDDQGHDELSYVFFENHLDEIHIVIRPKPPEGSQAFHRWVIDHRQLISQSMWFNFRRSMRNIWNTLRDAFAQTLGVVVGQFRSKNPAAVLAAADQKITSTGQLIANFGNNAYEPILEKYLGKDVVGEMLHAERWLEQVGMLEEYSDKFILLRDVCLDSAISVPKELGTTGHVDVAFPRSHSLVRHLAIRKGSRVSETR